VRDEDVRPFAREWLPRRAAPFALVMALAFAALPVSLDGIRPLPLAGAALLTAALAAAAWLAPWPRLPVWLDAGPPLAWFAVVILLRESAAGAAPGVAPLVLLPVLWLLLYGSRRQVGAAIGGLVLTLGLPLAAGGHASPSELRVAIVCTVVSGLVCFTFLRLVDEVRRQAERLEELASTDAVTGLPNRRVWDDALPRELARSLRNGAPLAVAILDLDRFSAYNDSHGHQGGDLLLKEIAALWPGELRESDLLARYGGQEFALLLPDCGQADVLAVVEKVRRAMPSQATCSAGVAGWDGVEEPEALVRRADEALHAAKRAGRDRTVVAGHGTRPEPAGA
jgi:diguanylate cyclase (GGDEF)-like protein